MIRKEIQQGAITIAYGHDILGGYFLHAQDTRLRAEGEDEGWDAICESIGSGGGVYLNVYTNEHGPGETIDKKLMERLWKAYNVPDKDLALLNVKMHTITDVSIEGLLGPKSREWREKM